MNFTIVKVTGTNGQEKFNADSNGNYPVILTNLAGRMPVVSKGLETKELSSIHVMNGTIAANSGITPESTLMVQFAKTGTEDYERKGVDVTGEQYNITVVSDLSSNPVAMLNAAQQLGEPVNYLIKETAVSEVEANSNVVDDNVN